MRPTIIPRDQVAEHFAVSPTLLIRYEARGLIESIREGESEGYGPFRRSFDLGAPVDTENITALFEQGILTIHIPKLAGGATTVPVTQEGS